MNLLFELFRGGLIFEVRNIKEAMMAEKSGALALLIDHEASPLHLDGDTKFLEEILEKTRLPILCSFHPGHFVEVEMLAKMGIWGMYADSRLAPVSEKDIYAYLSLSTLKFPLLADVEDIHSEKIGHDFIPVIRSHESLEEILEVLREKQEEDFVFIAGEIETVSDIALLKRMGADVIIIPHSVFSFPNIEKYLSRLVQASLYFDNSEKLAQLLEKEPEEKPVKKFSLHE